MALVLANNIPMEGSPLNVTKLLYLLKFCKAPWVTKRTDLRIENKCPSVV